MEAVAATVRVAVIGTLAAMTMALVIVGGATPAAACSCGGTSDEQALARADAAFVGSLVDIVPPERTGIMSSADPERFVFDVDEVFKGEITVVQSVVTARDGASCGLEIAGAGPFLVFAFEESTLTSGAREGEVYSHLCSGTRPISSGDIPASFEGRPPIPATTPVPAEESSERAPAGSTDDDRSGTDLVLWIGAGLAAVLAAATLVVLRARKVPDPNT